MKKSSPLFLKNTVIEPSESLENRVLEIIRAHKGKENAVSRNDLIYMIFGLNLDKNSLQNSTLDREIRFAIADLRQSYPILSTSKGSGYYMPSSREEILQCAAEINKRANKLFAQSQRMRHFADVTVSQLSLFKES
jgi:hypothetical protein